MGISRDIIRKLNILKDYSSLVVPVVLSLAAVLLFILTPILMGSKLKKDMTKQSISKYRQIKTLSKSVVAGGQWKEEEKYQRAYAEDANEIALLGRQSTQRQLLSYKIFPEPKKGESMLIFEKFGQQFRDVVDGLLDRVNAGDCPTKAELDKHLKSSSGSYSRSGPSWVTGGSYQDLNEEAMIIRNDLCRKKAKSASVYANPADLSGYDFWGKYEYATYAGMDEAVEDCWYWQLAHWIIEDVINTIDVLNSGSNSVFTSPAKRLLSVDFSIGGKRQGRIGEKPAGNRPGYILSTGEGQLTESCTGRVCNDDIDVVHFKVSVIVRTRAVLPFMQQLCSAREHKFRVFFGEAEERTFKHNQITILESSIEPIEPGDELHSLYRYSEEDAVVKLDLICEYIFNKSGYDEIKPASVKELLKKPEEQPVKPEEKGRELPKIGL